MRIAVAARSLPAHTGAGGMERVTESLARAWAAAGHEVSVFTTPLPQSRAKAWEFADVVELDGTPGRYSDAWGRRLARQHFDGFDVVLGVSAAARMIARRKSRPPVVMQAHGTSLDEIRTKLRVATPHALATAPRNAWWLLRDLRDYRRYDAVVGVGPAVTRTLLRTYPAFARPRRYTEIVNGVPPAAAPPSTARQRLHAVFVGRVHREKGVDRALRALARGDGTLTVCGDGPDLELMRELAHELGVGQRVDFTGAVGPDEVRRRMQEATAVAVPTLRHEVGLPLVALEALMEGIPVLASQEVVAAFGSDLPIGVVQCDFTSQSLEEELTAVASLPSDTIAHEVASRFSIEASARSYLELFSALSHGGSSAAE